MIVISAGGGHSLTSTMQVLAAAPALFTANQNGSGVVAATAYRQVLSTHISSPVPVFQCQDPTVGCVSVPIQLGVDTPVFVTFNATGLRGRSGDAGVQLTVAGQQMSIQSITALDDNGAAPGVDQLLVPIRSRFAELGRLMLRLPLTARAQTSAGSTFSSGFACFPV